MYNKICIGINENRQISYHPTTIKYCLNLFFILELYISSQLACSQTLFELTNFNTFI